MSTSDGEGSQHGAQVAAPGYSASELLVCCIAREVTEDRVWGLGLGTSLPSVGIKLAQMTHAPDVIMYSSAATAYLRGGGGRYWMTRLGDHGVRASRTSADRLMLQGLDRDHGEFFRPAQLDLKGAVNVTMLRGASSGASQGGGRMIAGGTGIPDVFGYYDDIFIYVPRHDRRTFVKEVDFATALPPAASSASGGGESRPYRVLTNLGIFWFYPGRGLVVESLHPGVPLDDVRDATSFGVAAVPDHRATAPPTARELELIREVIDPLGARDLEFMDSRARRDSIRRIYAQENGADVLRDEASGAKGPEPAPWSVAQPDIN